MRPQDFEELRKFYKHRLALNYGDNSSKETPEFWDSMAENYAKKAHSKQERQDSEDFLNRFSWEKGETVLDVACGPGTFAIPLAKRGCKVTATDFSAEMLRWLKLQADKENCQSIDCIHGRWLEMNLQGQYDTVMCMSGLGVISADSSHEAKLGETLEQLYKLAKKRLIILIPHADSHLNADMQHILGEDDVPIERLRIAMIYYAMVDHGMLPSLQIIKRPFKWFFEDVDDACKTLLKKSGIKDVSPDILTRLKNYLKTVLQKDDSGKLTLNYPTSQALYVVER